MKLKIVFLTIWLTCILFTIFSLFWKNELQYLKATPVPANYKKVNRGDVIHITQLAGMNNSNGYFLHFFNPECPCSKFNLPHVRSLVKKYDSLLQFAVVVMETEKKYTAEDIQQTLGEKVPVFFDNEIAVQCGVYSTPQAVILDKEGKLYYRGNYNKSRYCTNQSSNYAQMAIDSFLYQVATPHFDQVALKAYGCELPGCTR